MEGAGGDEEDVIGSDHAEFSAHRGAFNQGEKVPLNAFPGNIRTTMFGPFADLVDFLKCSTDFSSCLTELTKSLRAEFHDIIDFARVINKGDAKTTLKMLKEKTQTGVSNLKYTELKDLINV